MTTYTHYTDEEVARHASLATPYSMESMLLNAECAMRLECLLETPETEREGPLMDVLNELDLTEPDELKATIERAQDLDEFFETLAKDKNVLKPPTTLDEVMAELIKLEAVRDAIA